jgi:hypothetical protein
MDDDNGPRVVGAVVLFVGQLRMAASSLAVRHGCSYAAAVARARPNGSVTCVSE